jgi:hypothetical protein
LILSESTDNEVDGVIIQDSRFGLIIRGDLQSAHDGGRSGTGGGSETGTRRFTTHLSGVLDESRGELGEGELERESTVGAGALVAFNHASEFASPLSSEIANGQIQGFRLGVGTGSKAFPSHEILKASNKLTEGFITTLARDFIGCRVN